MEKLIDLLKQQGIRSQSVLDAFAHIDRQLFVHAVYRHLAYDNTPLPIDCGQTISQPFIVAQMTELALSRGHILEIGTGSGYQAAILS